MKKLFLLAAAMLLAVAASAQGRMGIGVGVNYGIASDYKSLGFDVKYQYEFVKNVRGEVSLNYYLPKDDAFVWDVDLNFHYLFSLGEKAKVYPLVGITYLTSALTGDVKDAAKAFGLETSSSKVGFNVGGGIDYYLTSDIKLNAEVKYQYAGDNVKWPVIGVGIAYEF